MSNQNTSKNLLWIGKEHHIQTTMILHIQISLVIRIITMDLLHKGNIKITIIIQLEVSLEKKLKTMDHIIV